MKIFGFIASLFGVNAPAADKGGKLPWLLGCRTTAPGSPWNVPHGDEY
jgi:hypothetical protein